jgi:hypothetical protein
MKQCPECGSQTGLREIIYGLPDKPFDDELYETGGCCISEKDPTRMCRECGWEGEFINNLEDLTPGY